MSHPSKGSSEEPIIKKKVDESWKDAVHSQKDAEPSAAATAHAATEPEQKPQGAAEAEGEPTAGAPEPNFTFFVSSLGMQTLMAMGEMPDPHTGEPAKADLAQAQYLIEILRMIADKTKNNLSAEEEQILKNLLYELQMRFVQKTQAASWPSTT